MVLTDLTELISKLNDHLQGHLDANGKTTVIVNSDSVCLYLPFKTGDMLANVIGELKFDATDYKKTAVQAFSEIASYVDTVKNAASIKEDLAKLDIEIAAVQNAMYVATNQYDVTIENDRTDGANNVIRLLAHHVEELKIKRKEKSRGLTEY